MDPTQAPKSGDAALLKSGDSHDKASFESREEASFLVFRLEDLPFRSEEDQGDNQGGGCHDCLAMESVMEFASFSP